MENSLCYNIKFNFFELNFLEIPLSLAYSLCHLLTILIKYKRFFMNHDNINVLYILVDAWWQKN